MKVKEMIKKLQEYDENAEILISTYNNENQTEYINQINMTHFEEGIEDVYINIGDPSVECIMMEMMEEE